MLEISWIFTVCIAIFLQYCSAQIHVWPSPKHISISQDGDPISISNEFRFALKGRGLYSDVKMKSMARIKAGIARMNKVLQNKNINYHSQEAGEGLKSLEVLVVSGSDHDDYPSGKTKYDYNITINNNVAEAYASSQYGALYAMETFMQLIDENGRLPGSSIEIIDEPQNDWRGLLIDSGRRFYPVKTVENLLDVMSMVKLNVLHLHANDQCRFSVESKKYPTLTSSLVGEFEGSYSQDDIKHLIEYAADRGIRVVPEIDVPGHAEGFKPLVSEGLKYCPNGYDQLYDDPEGNTYKIIRDIFEEMAGLFKDEVIHIGADETHSHGDCTLESTYNFENRLLQEIESNFGKTTEGWEEVLYVTKAATPQSVVNAWHNYWAHDIIETGRRAVESQISWFYFHNPPKSDYPKGWAPCWNDIAHDINETSRHMLLGGEMSMWGDSYCKTKKCDPNEGPVAASSLFPPEKDEEFGISVGGMIWPRGYVGAGAFWGYDSSIDSQSAEFEDMVWKLNDQVIERGGKVCPTKCFCDQLTQCGNPISI